MENRVQKLEDFRGRLRIDPDDLNGCLEEQSELYFEVAEEHVQRVATRDAIKLDLDEAMAALDHQLRQTAADKTEKKTEAGFLNEIKTSPKVMKLNREFLEARAAAASWEALKSAFEQRSSMLKLVVQNTLAHLQHLGLERGVASTQRDNAELARKRLSLARDQRKGRGG